MKWEIFAQIVEEENRENKEDFDFIEKEEKGFARHLAILFLKI